MNGRASLAGYVGVVSQFSVHLSLAHVSWSGNLRHTHTMVMVPEVAALKFLLPSLHVLHDVLLALSTVLDLCEKKCGGKDGSDIKLDKI